MQWRNNPLRRILICSAVALPFAVALIAGCDRGEERSPHLTAGDLPDQVFHDFRTMESDSGQVKWVLRAPVARIYNSRKLLVTDNPRIEFFDDKGEPVSVLTSDKGEINQVTHDFTTLGNVVVTSEQGYMLETESLVWLNHLEKIQTEDFVHFTWDDNIGTGYGFESDPGLTSWEIKRDVRFLLRDDDGVVDEEVRKETDERE